MYSNKNLKRKGQHSFSAIEGRPLERSSLDRSFGVKTTMFAGDLVPIFCQEALPGDTFNLKMATFGRFATLLHPILDNMYLETFFFFCPNRLVHDDWVKLQGEQVDPGDSIDFLVPQITINDAQDHSIHDYFNIPTHIPNDLTFSSLHLRMYNLIYNEWFRAQNLTDSKPVPRDAGPDDPADFEILKRTKRFDYFTSANPWPQKGDSVALPLGDSAPVSIDTSEVTGTGVPTWTTGGADRNLEGAAGSDVVTWTGTSNTGQAAWSDPQLEFAGGTGTADLTGATAATINELRQAIAIQHILEGDARGGTRYVEILQHRFGISKMDRRLQRPEYIGGSHQPIVATAVPVTYSPTVLAQAIGELGAFATTQSSGNGFVHSCDEHGYIIGLACLRADLNYQQGIPKQFLRENRYDFFTPELAHLGEQAILSKELFADGTAGDEDVFGYQERWAELRYSPSCISGQFRSASPLSLDTYHLAQDFENRPVLDEEFILEDPPVDRVIAVTDEPDIKLDIHYKLTHARPIPVYSTPGLKRL